MKKCVSPWMVVTSFTSAAAFCSNLASAIPVGQCRLTLLNRN